MTEATFLDPQPEALARLLSEHNLSVPEQQVAPLDAYRVALWQKNQQLNLTRHTTLEKFVGRDVFDSLQLASLLAPRQRVLDVGTGGGVPGLILAICRPDLRVSVCESVQKKARAVESLVSDLNLPVEVYACRAEETLQLRTFDTLVARGVASLAKMLRWFAPHWDAFDRLLIIKGPRWVEERGEARHFGLLKHLELRKAATYLAPLTQAESVILSIARSERQGSRSEHEGRT